MVSPIDSEEEGVPIPTNSSPSTNGRRRGSRVLQSSLEIAFSCKSGRATSLASSPPRLLRVAIEPRVTVKKRVKADQQTHGVSRGGMEIYNLRHHLSIHLQPAGHLGNHSMRKS
jgi:hypothetical protein